MTSKEIRHLERQWKRCSEAQKKAIVDAYVAREKEDFTLAGFHSYVNDRLCCIIEPGDKPYPVKLSSLNQETALSPG